MADRDEAKNEGKAPSDRSLSQPRGDAPPAVASDRLRSPRSLACPTSGHSLIRAWQIPRENLILGGSGQVGAILSRAFPSAAHAVVVLSRNPPAAPWRTVAWDGETIDPWTAELDGADVVINLAGRNVSCRYRLIDHEELEGVVNIAAPNPVPNAECFVAMGAWLRRLHSDRDVEEPRGNHARRPRLTTREVARSAELGRARRKSSAGSLLAW
jgi:NAD dependent epimerase/dehydratase family